MSDDIRRLSDELARDPSSLVFIQLGEELRHTGQLDLALRVALRGLERHPHDADAHDLLARIHVDRNELTAAFDEWDTVLQLAPGHVGARKGVGYVLFKQGRLTEAERYLSQASAQGGGDPSIATALHMVRRMLHFTDGTDAPDAGRRVEEEARRLFAEILGEGEQTALLLDASGLVTAGLYITEDGRDVGQEVGASLAGISEDAARAAEHLGLGPWSSVTFETDVATVAMSPVLGDSLVLVAAARSVPLGLVRRVLQQCSRRASAWLEATS
jgi:predicted regulator of Ras-like GTPase activity (Roadblock/LC7/MglB family)